MSMDCVEFCRALADPNRQRILQMLLRGEMCVGDIVAAFGTSQPTISHHLGVLRQAGLVTGRRDGKQVFYAIDRANVVECCGLLMARFEVQDACAC